MNPARIGHVLPLIPTARLTIAGVAAQHDGIAYLYDVLKRAPEDMTRTRCELALLHLIKATSLPKLGESGRTFLGLVRSTDFDNDDAADLAAAHLREHRERAAPVYRRYAQLLSQPTDKLVRNFSGYAAIILAELHLLAEPQPAS